MKFFLAILALASLSGAELGGLLMCTGPNATGNCTYAVYPMDKCQVVPEPFFSARGVRTFAPDGERFWCYPCASECPESPREKVPCTSPTGCVMGPVWFDHPNKFDLSASGRDTFWPRGFPSFRCTTEEPVNDYGYPALQAQAEARKKALEGAEW